MRWVLPLVLVLGACGAPSEVTTAPTATAPSTATAAPSTTLDAPQTAPALRAQPTPSPRPIVTLALFDPDQVMAGMKRPSRSWTTRADLYFPRLGPDGETIVADIAVPGATEVRTIHLPTGREQVMQTESLHIFSRVEWLPDGRLIVTGPKVLVGAPGGAARSVASIFSQNSALSPSGRRLALWTYGEDVVRILDIASGTALRLPDRYRRCVADGVVAIAWSPDETELALSDCDDENDGGLRTWIVAVASGSRRHALREIAVATWTTSGFLFGRGPFSAPKEPELLRVDRTGARLSRHPSGMVSPDGRHIARTILRAAPTPTDSARRTQVTTLLDVASGRSVEVREDAYAVGWSRKGEVVVVALDERPGAVVPSPSPGTLVTILVSADLGSGSGEIRLNFHARDPSQVGAIEVMGPDGQLIGTVPVTGSGMYDGGSCVAKLGQQGSFIGHLKASPDLLRDLLARPEAYGGRWSRGDGQQAAARFVDSGCRGEL